MQQTEEKNYELFEYKKQQYNREIHSPPIKFPNMENCVCTDRAHITYLYASLSIEITSTSR